MSRALRRYSVYGECLASDIEFPELAPRQREEQREQGEPRWTFRTDAALPPMVDATLIGEETIYQNVGAHLYAHRDGHRIRVDDTGHFDLSADHRMIRWERLEPAWPDFVRAHLTGRVLATAMYLDGFLPLHASAIGAEDGVVAFLAPKGFGKSTLALALVEAGARLVSDDTLPIDSANAPVAWPGVHALRVHADSVRAVRGDLPEHRTDEGKHLVNDIPDARRAHAPTPLAALYLLDPTAADSTRVERTALDPMFSAIGVVAHVKIGRMLGAAAAAPMLERAARIARAVPVFRLHVPRDLARLPEAARQVLEWHGGAPG